MKSESIRKSAVACILSLALFAVASGWNLIGAKGQDPVVKDQTTMTSVSKSASGSPNNPAGAAKDDESQSRKAAQMFKDIMSANSKGGKRIPQNVMGRAECVAAFTEVRTVGSIVKGRGLVSCRTGGGWSAPVYLTISGDNLAARMSVKSSDMIMMFMSRDSMSSMLMDKITVGAGAPSAAGPVGQDTGASTDAVMNAQILCYLRNKGLLAGAAMDGAVIEMDREGMRDVYGDSFNFKEILEGAKTNANSKVMSFSETLARYTPRQATK